jgi:cytochrome P450
MEFMQADLAEIDLFGTAFQTEPDTEYARALKQGGLARCPFGALVIGHQEVRDALRDPRVESGNVAMVDMLGVPDGPWRRWIVGSLQGSNGDVHARLRKLVVRAFTPRQADQHRPLMRELVSGHIDELLTESSSDFMASCASVYPITVFCNMIGVPEHDVPLFGEWAETLGRGLDMNIIEILDELNEATVGMSNYVERLIARHTATDTNLIGRLLAASEDGERLSRDELVSLIMLLLGAGYDTTANELGWGVLLLAQRPDILERLGRNPEDAPKFVEELLRYRPAAAAFPRIASEDIELADISVPAGTYLMVSPYAAGHDPSIYPSPEEFDVDRVTDQPLLSFGWADHYCIGLHIARAEMQEFFAVFARRVGRLELTAPPSFGNPLGVYAVKTLPIAISARSE